jgi:hypothetical protein
MKRLCASILVGWAILRFDPNVGFVFQTSPTFSTQSDCQNLLNWMQQQLASSGNNLGSML